jgi:hypothetical protein
MTVSIAVRSGGIGEAQDERESQLALAQVGEDRLSQVLLGGGVVEQVVLELEGGPEGEAEAPQGFGALFGSRDEEGRNTACRGEKESGLAPHDLEVVADREVDRAPPLGAEDLSLGHREGNVGEEVEDADVPLLERDLHPLHVEIVAEENGQLISPAPVHADAPAAGVGPVDDVIVDERCRVDQLQDGSVFHVDGPLVAEEARGQEEKGWADPFAPAVDEVFADEGDGRDV